MDRLKFIKVLLASGFSMLASRCVRDGGSAEAEAAFDSTVLDALTRNGHAVTLTSRVLDSRMENYATAVDEVSEDPSSKAYWIFFIDGQAINGAVDKMPVTKGQMVTALLIRPLEIIAAPAV